MKRLSGVNYNFAENLRIEIQVQGLSQKGLSRMSGVHYTMISLVIICKRGIGLNVAIRLSKALGKTVDQMLVKPDYTRLNK